MGFLRYSMFNIDIFEFTENPQYLHRAAELSLDRWLHLRVCNYECLCNALLMFALNSQHFCISFDRGIQRNC